MTPPRCILPGATYLVTRRCAGRRFRLVPRKCTNAFLGYCLAVAARRFAVEIHVATALSNHYHAVVTDPQGRISDFLQYFHSLTARGLNLQAGTRENLWSTEGCSIVRLVDSDDVVAKVSYCLTNPVAANLVKTHQQWPGLLTPMTWLSGSGKRFDRPKHLFRDNGPMPLTATLHLTVPPMFGAAAQAEYVRAVDEATRATEALLAEKRAASGTRVLGVDGVRRQRRTQSATSPEPRRGVHPAIAAKRTAGRIAALTALVAFRQSYRAALASWCSGRRDTVFPPGTLQMVRLHGALAHPPPAGPLAA